MKIAYIDNYDSFANTIASYFRDAGAEVVIYKSDSDLEIVENENPDLLLLGPGPNSPEKAGNYLDAIERFHQKIPIFGICLGFQAIMNFFGSKIIQLDEIIHGSSSEINHDSKIIFQGINNPEPFARYHSLGIDVVPEDFVITAKAGEIVMGARHKNLPIEGILFHPESILSLKNNAGKKLISNVVREYGKNNSKTD